jgi:hypothetical protein
LAHSYFVEEMKELLSVVLALFGRYVRVSHGDRPPIGCGQALVSLAGESGAAIGRGKLAVRPA